MKSLTASRSEHDHNRAPRQNIEFLEFLDKSQNDATVSFYRTLEQIEAYPQSLGKSMREAHDRIFDAEYQILEEAREPAVVAPRLAPPA